MNSVFLCTVVNFAFGPKGREARFAFASAAERDQFLTATKPLGWHAESIGDVVVTTPEDAQIALPKKMISAEASLG
jgi:hypothetical protein